MNFSNYTLILSNSAVNSILKVLNIFYIAEVFFNVAEFK